MKNMQKIDVTKLKEFQNHPYKVKHDDETPPAESCPPLQTHAKSEQRNSGQPHSSAGPAHTSAAG